MRTAIILFITTYGLTTVAQVTNEVQVYVRPGTEMHVFENFTNTASGNVTIDEEGVLYVDGSLTNNGTMSFQNDASLLRGSTGTDGGSGTYNVRREGGATGNQFSMWSAPVTNHPAVSGTTYRYDETASTQSPADDQPSDPGWSAYSGAMPPGEGFAAMGAGTVNFSGSQLNNGNVNISLFSAPYDPASLSAGTPFNLLGNPYPSGLDLAELVADNPDVFGSIYLWSDDGSDGTDYAASDYSVWNQTGSLPYVSNGVNGDPAPNGFIKTGQAFMLRNDGASSLQFNNSQRVSNVGSNAFYKQPEENTRLWFSINGPDESYFNQILIGLLEDATNQEDRLYDAVKLMGNTGTSLASQAHGNDYAILAFPPPLITETIPLTINVADNANYNFKVDRMEAFDEFDVYLYDVETDNSHLLQEDEEVMVSLAAGSYTDRFYLNFVPTPATGIEDIEESPLTAYAANGYLTVGCNSCAPNASIDLLDMSGRIVMSERNPDFEGGMSVSDISALSTGVYVVRVVTDNQVLSQKIINQ